MNKRILLLPLVAGFICGSLFTLSLDVDAKNGLKFKYKNSYSFVANRFSHYDEISDWEDEETGVHYLVVFNEDNNIVSVTPRYNEKGKIMITN